MTTDALGARIAAARRAAGLTQQELAALIGSDTGTVSRWERGRRNPRKTTILAVASVLNVTASALRGEDAEAGGVAA
jgi:transcriptional regulator with XRE-family HTH domain